ncbi:MAG: serine hydrolase, partial [Patescibacteria group bacterium]|nr:serine hydrolase [Patescibacteria group bacterium]
MKRPSFETIFSYVVSGSLACAILVLGLSFIYLKPDGIPTIAKGVWPAPLELNEQLITARAAVVYDLVSNRTLYAKNADEVLPLASLTKLLTAQAVLAREDVTTEVPITAEAIQSEGDWGFRVGEHWPLGDLLRFALAASSNDAIAAAASALGPDKISIINSEAKELGLTETQVLNPTGLDESGELAGGYGSAHDVALLVAAFLQKYPTFFEGTAARSVTIQQNGRTLVATS